MRKWVLVIILLVGLATQTACAAWDSPSLSREEDRINEDKIDEIVRLNFEDPSSFAYPEIAAESAVSMVLLFPQDSENRTVRIGWVFLPSGEEYAGVKGLSFKAFSYPEDSSLEVRIYSWNTLEHFHWVWEGDWKRIIVENEDWWHSLARKTYQVSLKSPSSSDDPVQDVSLPFDPKDNLAAIEFVVRSSSDEGFVTIAEVELTRDVERVKEWEELQQLLGK